MPFMKHQLIIIGNGFDRTAKLESTYDAFFNWHFKDRLAVANDLLEKATADLNKDRDQDTIESLIAISNLVNPKQVNYWFEVFWKNRPRPKGMHWSDIETVVLKELTKIDSNYDEYYQNRIDSIYNDSTRNTIGEKLATMETPMTNASFDKKMLSRLEIGGSDGKGGTTWTKAQNIPMPTGPNPNDFHVLTSKEVFISALYLDLLELERNFITFLTELIAETSGYPINANQLISELIVKEYIERPNGTLRPDDDYFNKRNSFISSQTVKTQILSFNYTHETNDQNFVNADLYNNVHGELKLGQAVFGIDGHLVGDNYLLLPFTKTYRIMEFGGEGFKLRENIDKIKIFGHGLAEADYSYFQTIFDSLDLYNANTEVIFYYNIYDEEDRLGIKERFKQSVYKLIRRYGSTLTNKDHGKNMLHKLIIEGRIKVTELDTTFIKDTEDY